MAATPEYKVYTQRSYVRGEYVAACKYLEDAAALVAFLGAESEIRWGHSVKLWREGHEDQPASESYDHVRNVCLERRNRHAERVYDKNHGPGAAADVLRRA